MTGFFLLNMLKYTQLYPEGVWGFSSVALGLVLGGQLRWDKITKENMDACEFIEKKSHLLRFIGPVIFVQLKFGGTWDLNGILPEVV